MDFLNNLFLTGKFINRGSIFKYINTNLEVRWGEILNQNKDKITKLSRDKYVYHKVNNLDKDILYI